MVFGLDNIIFDNDKVFVKLVSYLSKLMTFKNFNYNMRVRVYVNKDCVFTAWESVDYNIQFTSCSHKLLETITSPYVSLETDFMSFYNYLLSKKSSV